jgi:Methyltransferase domain
MIYWSLKAWEFTRRWCLAFFGALYALTLGLVRRTNRDLMLTIASHFGYVYRRPSAEKLPRVAMATLFPEGLDGVLSFDRAPSRPSIRVMVLSVGENGSMGVLDLATVVGLTRAADPRAVFEIGTFLGSSAYNFALNTAPDCRIFTLDLPRAGADYTVLPIEAIERQYIDKKAPDLRFKGTPIEAKITQLHGDSATFDFSPYAGRMDLVFVDGSHSYDYVMNDARIAVKLLRNGKGLILFHDYGTWAGVTRALEELRQEPQFSGLTHVAGTPVALLRVG